MRIVISILRQSKTLVALVSKRTAEFEIAAPGVEPLRNSDAYQEIVCSLSDIDLVKAKIPDQLFASWQSLSAVTTIDAQTLFDILVVLSHTLPDTTHLPDVSHLTIPDAATVHTPTSANPRAYQGTKVKPPKSKKTKPIDLRSHLSNPDHLNQLLIHLAPHFPQAKQMLQAVNLPVPCIPSLVEKNGRPIDVFLRCHFCKMSDSVWSLPWLFVRHFLYALRTRTRQEVGTALALYYGLELEQHPSLLQALRTYPKTFGCRVFVSC